MNNSLIFRFAIALILPFMLLVVAPLSFYFGNINEVNFHFQDVMLPLLGVLLGISVIIFFVLSFLRRLPKILGIFTGLLVGFSAAVWIQSQLFVWRFGQLDGRKFDWNQWTSHMWLEWVVWLLVITTFIILYYRGKEKLKKTVLYALFILGLLSITSSYFTAPQKIERLVDEKGFE